MKILYLLRHAETESHAPRDRDRRLTAKGEEDMNALAETLRARDVKADHILCSPAQRTRETARLVLPFGAPVLYPDQLYETNTAALLEALKAVPDQYNALWLINHNPAIHGLAAFLAAGSDHRLTMGYAPGTLSIFSCALTRWADLSPDNATLTEIIIP